MHADHNGGVKKNPDALRQHPSEWRPQAHHSEKRLDQKLTEFAASTPRLRKWSLGQHNSNRGEHKDGRDSEPDASQTLAELITQPDGGQPPKQCRWPAPPCWLVLGA